MASSHLALAALLLGSCQLSQPADLPPVAQVQKAISADLPVGASEDWWQEVRSRIVADQRSFHVLNGVFTANVRGVQAQLEGDAFHVRKGTDELVLRLDSWGRGDSQIAEAVSPVWGACVAGAGPLPDGDCVRRVELHRNGITEFWQPTSSGFEQGWEIESRLPGSDLLELHLDIANATSWTVDSDGDGVQILASQGRSWRYEGLKAWDATGTPLTAWMTSTPSGVSLRVDDTGAVYPLTVDPTLTEDNLLRALRSAVGDRFGIAVSNAGDVDGDGYDDVIVGAYSDDFNGLDSGSAYVYLGSAAGVVLETEIKLIASDGQIGDSFGESVAGAGDVNGDGYDDVIIGAPSADDNGLDSGAAYVYLGGISGIDSATEIKLLASEGELGDAFGISVSGAGDTNNDGYDDVIVGAWLDDISGLDSGSAYAYLGDIAGVDPSSEIHLGVLVGSSEDWFGHSVSGAGDVDGDGYDDVIIGAYGYSSERGAVYVYSGSTFGIDVTSRTFLTATGGASNDRFGESVSGAGDVNGDGFDDVVVGSAFDDNGATDAGSAFVYQGSVGGVDSLTERMLNQSNRANYDHFGVSVSGAGDLDGDGYDDIIIGADDDSCCGTAHVFSGSATGIDNGSRVGISASDEANGDGFGIAVSGGGDVDGDGFDDVIIGAWVEDFEGSNAGAAYVQYGNALGVDTKLVASDGTSGDRFGWAVSSAGDVNGDGIDDVIVGTAFFEGPWNFGVAYVYLGTFATGLDNNTELRLVASDATQGCGFGYDVAGAGDVNGDGYDDVIVGTLRVLDIGPDPGSAYVYLGGANGTDPATEIKLVPSDGASDDRFGKSVDGAGDLNGDGYDDVIVGAYFSDTGGTDSGAAYAYLGSVSGILQATETKLIASDGFNEDYFGSSVAGVGDLNGDGFDDVAIGSHETDNQGYGWDSGSAYLYMGSVAGVDQATEFELIPPDGDENDHYAYSVSAAGDVNGDGYADLIVGAYGADGGRGAAYLYSGGAGGLDPVHDIRLTPIVGVGSLYFGRAVSTAGDVDGDGYDDVVISAFGNLGGSQHIYVYAGSVTGIDPNTATTFPFASTNSSPTSVAGAGDVDGDGYDDVIAGEISDSTNGIYAGRARSFLGQCFSLSVWYADTDSDGFGSNVSVLACTQPSGYVLDNTDCDDSDANAHPGGVEVCDPGNVDEDCNGFADDDDGGAIGRTLWYVDVDSDGYGDPGNGWSSCDQPTGYIADGTDCDDGDPTINPGQLEVCDGANVDEDCSGAADDNDPGATGQVTWFIDMDLDGYGDGADSVISCEQPWFYVANDSDCDDSEPGVNPAQAEVCDPADVDEDCSGAADDDDAGVVGAPLWHLDADADGYGGPLQSEALCEQPSGYVADATDCDDARPGVNPGEMEVCDADDLDEDCSGAADNADPGAVGGVPWYADADSDGYGDPASSVTECDAPLGYVADDTDCNDNLAGVNPGEAEVCDPANLDEDCSGAADDADPGAVGQTSWYADSDGDGYGDLADTRSTCDQPTGYVADDTDCDDNAPGVNPGQPEICDPADVDEDCSGQADDADPGATDRTLWHPDDDGDGFGDGSSSEELCDQPPGSTLDSTDCNDGEATVYPGASELCDGQLNDCDGAMGNGEVDADSDGFSVCSLDADGWDGEGAVTGGDDCDDSDPAVFPGAEDLAGDGVDSDCDGSDGEAIGGDDEDPLDDGESVKSGCGCVASGSTPSGWLVLMFVAVVHLRRRKGARRCGHGGRVKPTMLRT